MTDRTSSRDGDVVGASFVEVVSYTRHIKYSSNLRKYPPAKATTQRPCRKGALVGVGEFRQYERLSKTNTHPTLELLFFLKVVCPVNVDLRKSKKFKDKAPY